MLERNPWSDSTKKAVRVWVKDDVKIKGEDAILWGKWEDDDLEYERLEEGTCPKPYWTEKQMRRRGEPQRKRMRREPQGEIEEGRNKLEEKAGEEGDRTKTKKMMIKENKSGDGEGKEGGTELPQGRKEGRISMKEQKLNKAERRERWKLKKATREKNKKEREKKQQEKKEEMVKKGRETTRKQYTLRMWATGGGPLGREHQGERKRGVKKGIG